jgi:hypothetical protein
MRDEGTKAIQSTIFMLVGGSLFIALLNLFLTRSRASSRPDDDRESEPTHEPLPQAMPLPPAANPH